MDASDSEVILFSPFRVASLFVFFGCDHDVVRTQAIGGMLFVLARELWFAAYEMDHHVLLFPAAPMHDSCFCRRPLRANGIATVAFPRFDPSWLRCARFDPFASGNSVLFSIHARLAHSLCSLTKGSPVGHGVTLPPTQRPH